MPGISGWHVAEEVKEINSKTPVALITGWGVELEEYELRKSGVDFILNKPFQVEQVLELITEGMRLRKKVIRMTQGTKKKKPSTKKQTTKLKITVGKFTFSSFSSLLFSFSWPFFHHCCTYATNNNFLILYLNLSSIIPVLF